MMTYYVIFVVGIETPNIHSAATNYTQLLEQ